MRLLHDRRGLRFVPGDGRAPYSRLSPTNLFDAVSVLEPQRPILEVKGSMRHSYVFLVALLAACATEEDVLAWMQARCEAYGFQPETEAMAECVQREHLAKDARVRGVRSRSGYFWGHY